MRAIVRAAGWRVQSLPVRVFLAGTLLVIVVLALVLGILERWAQHSGDAVVQRELEQSADLVDQVLSGRQRSLTGGARVFVQGPYFRAIVDEKRNREDILDQTFEAADQLDADWVFIVDERGTLLAKSDEPGASGGDLSGVPLIAGALQGHITSGFGVSRDSLLFQTVAVPIVVPGRAPIGALVATKMVDSVLARDVKAATSADIVFFVRDAKAGNRIAASTLGSALHGKLAEEVTERTRSRAVIGGARYATQRAAVATAGGQIIGGFVVMSARDATSAEIAEVRRALILAALLGFALVSLATFATWRRVARPVRDITSVTQRATDGDYTAEPAAPHAAAQNGGDEIGALGDAVQLLVAELRDRQALVSAINASVPAVARLATASTAAVAPSLTVHRVQSGGSRSSTNAGMRSISSPSDERARGELVVGDIVADRYLIDAVIGRGEMGITYRAKDRVAGRLVALKRLRAARIGEDGPRMIDVLRDDIRSVRQLAHRNVVRVHEVGEEGGIPFVTMDLVEGVSLAQLLRAGGPLTEEAVLSLAKQLCRALAAAASTRVVHGNLSPRQILLGYDGVVKVGDFALARIERRVRSREHADADAARGSAIPQLAGATVGTPEYMAPEQLLGEEPSTRADIYSAGVVLYECVTGATPFRTDSPLAFLAQKLGGNEPQGESATMQAARPSRSAIVLALSGVIGRMILADVDQRASSAGALLEQLERAG